MGYYSHDMKINSHVMRIVFFECTPAKIRVLRINIWSAGEFIFRIAATGRCMMEASGNVLRGGYNPQEKNGTICKGM